MGNLVNMLIVDTSFIIAYFNVYDPLHTQAILDMVKIEEDQELISINNLVLQEILTLHNIKYKQRTLFPHICSAVIDKKSTNMVFKMQSQEDFLKIHKKIFDKQTRKLSFVDLSLIIDCKSMKSGRILTYDKDLCKYCRLNKIPIFEKVKYEVAYSSGNQ